MSAKKEFTVEDILDCVPNNDIKIVMVGTPISINKKFEKMFKENRNIKNESKHLNNSW